ncbi:MAG TPA: hypothetical protein PLL09_10715 [Flavobacterium sp.]|uniref:hypothetical protein n=1 Tax=unclassified Flavobacterium TaxID=196869 RepID=UPI0025BF8ED9|nr:MULTISPECIES: hypothetical protein [unclassified Flavobacterium]HRE78282.1 hypothetical protein [Flavobacterium sp.]
MFDEHVESIFATLLINGQITAGFNNPSRTVVLMLKSKGYLITPYVNPDIFEPSDLGREVLQCSSWKSYIEKKDLKEKRLIEKEILDLKISRFKYYTLWPALILGVIGGFYSIFNIIKSFAEKPPTKIESTTEQPKSHISSEAKKSENLVRLKESDTIFYLKKKE